MLTEYKGEPTECQHHGLHLSFLHCRQRALYQYEGTDGVLLLCTGHAAKVRDHFQTKPDPDYSEVASFGPPPPQIAMVEPLVINSVTEDEPVIGQQAPELFAGGESGGGGGGADFGGQVSSALGLDAAVGKSQDGVDDPGVGSNGSGDGSGAPVVDSQEMTTGTDPSASSVDGN